MSAEVREELTQAAKQFSEELSSPWTQGRRVFQFFSFDIKNSTAYKRAQSDWPLLVDKFYELTWDRLSKDDDTFQFWKHVGDEVLAYRRVRSSNDAWQATQHVHRVLHSVIDSLHKAFPHSRQEQLSIKAASWIALCAELPSNAFSEARESFKRQDFSDILTRHSFETRQAVEAEQWDFLGPTIDSGFRIAKHSGPGVLVLSFELAYILCRYLHAVTQATEHTTFCRLVGYERLTGIWRDRPYPIIWYAPQDGTQFKYFGYDDKLELKERISSYEDGKGQPRLCDALDDIAADVGIEANVHAIVEILEAAKPESADEDSSVLVRPRGASPEVHCVAICVDGQGRCLVAKRLPTRRVFPDAWEWGCATLLPDMDFFDSMQQNYKAVFGIDITFPSRRPIATYFVREKKVPGIIFAATAATTNVTRNTGKHSEIRWIDDAEAQQLLDRQRTVPSFIENMRLARDVVASARHA